MDAQEFVKIRNSYFKEFLKENIRLYVADHAEERATEGERGEQVKDEHLIDFFSVLLNTVKTGENRDLNHVMNQAKYQFLEQHVTIQADVGAKKRQINVPAIIKTTDDGLLWMKLKTLMVKEKFKVKKEHRLIQL